MTYHSQEKERHNLIAGCHVESSPDLLRAWPRLAVALWFPICTARKKDFSKGTGNLECPPKLRLSRSTSALNELAVLTIVRVGGNWPGLGPSFCFSSTQLQLSNLHSNKASVEPFPDFSAIPTPWVLAGSKILGLSVPRLSEQLRSYCRQPQNHGLRFARSIQQPCNQFLMQ